MFKIIRDFSIGWTRVHVGLKTIALVVAAALFASEILAESNSNAALSAQRLRCNYLVDPLGIGVEQPELSWIVASDRRGAMQTAYRILVASSPEKLAEDRGDLWDSGRVESDETIRAPYEGRPLRDREQVYWKVQVWDDRGTPSSWSEQATWSAGLLSDTSWKAKWIGGATGSAENPLVDLEGADWIWTKQEDRDNGERVFFTKWTLPEDVNIASAWLTAVGGEIVSVFLNGHEVTQTMFRDEPLSVDVRSQLNPGNNQVSMMVRQNNEGPPGACVKLVVQPKSGTPLIFTTNGEWKFARQTKATDPKLWTSKDNENVWVAGRYGDAPWGHLRTTRLATEPPHYLRDDFSIKSGVRRATLSVTALGWADVYVNGERVSDDLFGSGWTEYKKRAYYRTYDVTSMLTPGDNAWGAILADGWYSGHIGWRGLRAHWGEHPRLKAQIDVEYEDGTVETITSNEGWRRSLGPTTVADILMGEEYDARKELGKWSSAGYDDSSWKPVFADCEVDPVLEAHPAPPVVVFKEWQTDKITEPKPGVYVFDFGQNFAGVCRLAVRGKPGQRIQLRFAERLNEDGTIYTTNLRTARAIDYYTCKGDGIEVWQPRQTFHGFQYAEVTGVDERPTADMLTAVAYTSDLDETGEFHCSDDQLNKLVSNILWTQRANFIEVPTDCPQRDERLGWTGDAQFYVTSACLNADVQSFFRKWMIDVVDAQREDGQYPCVAPLCVTNADGGPGYADAGVICPWTMYQVYGDKTLLKKLYPSMQKFIEFCENRSQPGGIAPESFHCFGDWLNVEDETPKDLVYTAYFGLSTQLMAKIARELGYEQDAASYDKLFAEIQQGFTNKYVDENGRIECNSQCAYVLALSFDLVPKELRPKVEQHLLTRIQERDWHMSTGFVGTRDLMPTLASINRNDAAYAILQQNSYPGWVFSVTQGATSIWEHWDGWTPQTGFEDAHMNSFSHYAFGSVYAWMVENIGGIRSGAPAYRQVVIAPQPGGTVTAARTSYDSIRGPISTDWTISDGQMHLVAQTPANTTTLFRLPTDDASAIKVDDKPLASLKVQSRATDGWVEFELPSGRYMFDFPARIATIPAK
ncbi:family 78 glycoside hydrolase catalytic domain [Aeoliella sp. SH292]|uniref:alpha-L-rhamnosidase n=1 Tax=Aeoliella sp. SH292 TaxID=3454464 RepID=UPI003F994AC5